MKIWKAQEITPFSVGISDRAPPRQSYLQISHDPVKVSDVSVKSRKVHFKEVRLELEESPFPLQPSLQSWWNPAGGAGTDGNHLEKEEPEEDTRSESSNRVRGAFLSINRVEGRAYTKRNSSSEPPTKVIRIPKMRATSVYWLTVNQRPPE